MATKFYLHRATFTGPGTMPGPSALGGTPTVTASGASTNRWLDGTVSGVAQTSAATNTDGTSNAQTAWHTRHVSAPLAAQTISAQTITYSLAASEGNANSNFNPSIYVSLWRPGTGTEVGSILAVGTITATEPGTTQTATSGTGTSTARTAQDGDVIIIETWRKSVAPSATAVRANTTFYDGTTEASTTNVASFVNFANTLTFLPISAQPTALAMTLTGATPTVTATNNISAQPTTLAMTFTGATPAEAINRPVQPGVLSMTLTGATPSVGVTNNLVSLPSSLTMTLTGAIPAEGINRPVEPTALAMALSGATPAVSTPVVSQPSALSMAWAGATPTIAQPVQVSPSALALAFSGAIPTVTAPVAVSPLALSLALSTATPAVEMPVTSQPDGLAITLSGATPIVTVSHHPTPPSNITVLPDVLALALAFATPHVSGVSKGGARAPLPHGIDPYAPYPDSPDSDEEILMIALSL